MKKITLLLILVLCVCGYRPVKALIPECIVGVIVVGTGVVLYIGIKKLCKNIPPLENPPAPPKPSTNAPPQQKMTITATSLAPRLTMKDDNVEAYNISAYTFENLDPYGNPYTRLFRTTVQSSEDLKNWSPEFSLVGWMSSQYVLIVYYQNGVPVVTNGSTLSFGSGTNETYLPINTASPTKFFR